MTRRRSRPVFVAWCYLFRASVALTGAGVLTAVFAAQVTAQTALTITYERYTLPNGLQVILHEDRSVPIVAVNTWYHVGSGDEQRGRTGFAHLFEHIMFMGSENVPVGAFDQLLEAAGANNNGSTSPDRTNYWEVMPSNALPLALWLDADRMGWLLPTMDQSKLDLQRDVVKNERRQGVDNVPYGRANETILAAMYPPSHPYSWDVIGSMADLSAASLEDVKEFFRMYYAPNNATLTISGHFDRDSVKTWVESYFGPIPRGPQMPSRPMVPEVSLVKDTVLTLEDSLVREIPRLYNAWPSVKLYHADDAALDVLAYVLAGDKNARLYKRLVYDLQVAQEVAAFQVSGKLDGNFNIFVTPKPGQAPQYMQQLVNIELNRVRKDGISARELTRAQNSIRAQFLDRLSSVLGKAEALNTYNYFANNPDWVRQDAERYDRVTAADVQRVATTYLGKPKVILTVVPAGKAELAVKEGGR